MNFINDNANIFFFTTTIFVVILILIGLVLLFLAIKIYRFIRGIIIKSEALIEDNKTNEYINKGAPIILPIILPILGFLFKTRKKKK